MIEVEIKVALANPAEFREKLKELNGKYLISLDHEDIYFNMPKGLRDFKKTDEALRLRKSTEFNKQNKNINELIKYYITYKGKKIDQTTKTREEYEVEVKNLEPIKIIFKNLGFREIYTIKKERELYEIIFKDQKLDILIDYLPILNQNFIEIELIVGSKNETHQTKEIMFDFLKQFGFSERDSIRESYLELIVNKLKLN